MSLILCIETGTDVCSVALARGGRLVSLREEAGRDHARKVALFADELFREAGISPRGLDAVAVGRGPGSYTGLRIGTSFAKGLCYALDVPLLAVDSLAAMAVIACDDREAGLFRSAQWESALLCPMIDARRMEVYAEVFDTSLESRSEVSAGSSVPKGSFSFSGAVRPRRSGCFRPRASGSSMFARPPGGFAGLLRPGSTRDWWRIPPTSNRLT